MPSKVLLVYPPSRTQLHESCPAALTMLAAVLEGAGHRVQLLDANATARKRSSEDVAREAEALRPDVIGMTLVTPIAREAYRLAGLLGRSGARLLAGGPHATLLPEEPLMHGFDAVVVGEGEPTIVDAVRVLRGELPPEDVLGLVYRDAKGNVVHAPPRPPVADLDALPAPARHLVDAEEYGGPDSPALHMNLFSSRGCPARCAYCAGGLFGRRFRFRSAESVVREMVDVHQCHGTRHFHFMDDAMTVNRPRMLEICERLVETGLGLTWSMMTRVDRVDPQLLTLLHRAGCVQIDYGIESGHPETLKRIHKPHDVARAKHIVEATAQSGIRAHVFFIFGFPWDTPESIDVTARYMVALAPFVARFHPAIASILIPFPGTEIYEKYKDEYGFAEWWLSEEKNFDSPTHGRHAYYQSQLFSRGAVLDADFFRYTPAVKEKIEDVFELMWRHDLRKASAPIRGARRALFGVSRALHGVSPALERTALAPAFALSRALQR
ncbi:MAG: cobalamin-dependent protein [Myxococcales bacterium]|nr:cobalamin-dependent protein [Myxococcales bacterium]MCB9579496.1 cobalamin B12-binding domain-containing protein [Polyangiaceae bacterium]